MQTTLHCPPTPRWLALFDRATRALRDAARSWGDRRRTAAAHAAFNALDDHTLRDLGLHRSAIASFSARPADSPCERSKPIASRAAEPPFASGWPGPAAPWRRRA